MSTQLQTSTIAEFTAQARVESYAFIDGSSRTFPSDAEKFVALAQAWHEHQIGSATLDFNHSAYHQIIGMGRTAIPFLLNRMQQQEVGWVYAIKCISGEQAAKPGMRGDEVLAAWLEWGRFRGFSIGRT